MGTKLGSLSTINQELFRSRYISESFIEVQFLSYMQALEGYHKKQNPKFKPKTGKKKVDLIDRIVDLLVPLQRYTAMARIIGSNPRRFAQQLIIVRNDLTHEADLKIPAIELGRNKRQLELIILTVLYHALGFSDALVEEISRNNIGFQTRMY